MEPEDEVEYMDTSEAPLSLWYYMADCGQWHKFEEDPEYPSSQDTEKQYLNILKQVFYTSSSGFISQFDFTAMLQTDTKTGKQRRIHRSCNVERKSCSCFSAVPVFWEMVDATLPYQLIPLNKSTAEYETVATYVKNDGLLDRSLVSIYRIQNQDLWEFFCRKKKQLMRIKGVKDIQERRLFHGTKKCNVDTICKFNFDIRLVGQNGHVFGKGTYFATHASFADKYSCSSADALPVYGRKAAAEKSKVIFLARVLVGKSTKGRPDLDKPDDVDKNRSHDSCVNDISFPTIFVIFDSNQIYPEYLIEYR